MSKRLYFMDDKEYQETYLVDDSPEDRLESMRDRHIEKYRVRTIRSGNMLEIEAYPIWNVSRRKRGKKKNISSEAQKRLNDENTVKHVKRMAHTNFTEDDIWAHLTYKNEKLPADPKEAKKDMTNYIRRLKHWLSRRAEYKDFELKYIYVTEFDDEEGRKVRIHHHIIMNFPDRDVAEDLWNGGGRVKTNRLQPDEHGLEGMVRYILKERADGRKKNKDGKLERRKTKRYSISRNMKQPTVTEADTKMTRKRAERIAVGEVDTQELFEKWHPDYQFNDVEFKFSDFVSGAYIYARMKRISPIRRE